tara:strand:- start:443 stop:1159 length:717 start_codon:yes stop_codon:yes gene_type:complete
MRALIGHTGFVGSNILCQAEFDRCYNTSNIEEIAGEEFDLVVCAGVSSVKWKANQNPNQDFEQIQRLVNNLSSSTFKKLVLVSTIAVYDNPVDNAYGRHRLYLETLLMNTYPDMAIIRLPALFGPGLKKNAIYDLMNKDYRFIPDPKSRFQYYCLDNIWRDIEKQIQLGIKTLNINSEGIEFGRVLKVFGIDPEPFYGNYMVQQDMQSNHASHWGKEGKYLYTQEEVLETLEEFINHE